MTDTSDADDPVTKEVETISDSLEGPTIFYTDGTSEFFPVDDDATPTGDAP